MRLIPLTLLALLGCKDSAPDDSGTLPVDADGDGVSAETDCDDEDAGVFPGNAETPYDGLDNDCDAGTPDDDLDADGFGIEDDCDDTNAAVRPDAVETCDGLDNDCNGAVDDAVGGTWYTDADADGFGDPATATQDCEGQGLVARAEDCDDADPAINPDAAEVCDGLDNDCDGQTDEDDAADAATWYADADADGFGDPAASTAACEAPSGHVADSADCDDADPAINPDAVEVCDGLDNDCDGDADEDDAADAATWYADADADGYGDPDVATVACAAPGGYVADATDCDDGEALSNPGETEVCDGLDNDCDGDADEGVTTTYYTDADADGYGDASASQQACTAPSGTSALSGDCDDSDAATNPGAAPGCDGEDYDCDGLVDNDADGDTWPDAACGGEDCDDTDASILPDANGLCALGLTCDDILTNYPSASDGTYAIDPDGWGAGLDPFEVNCDMSTDGGGWTEIPYAADLPFQQHYTGGDRWYWIPSDFTLTLSDDQITAIQALSAEGYQQYVGLCEHVLHYYYTASNSYAYAVGFRFFDGTETPRGASSYSPYDVTVSQDGCAANGGEGGAEANATIFEINSVLVPVVNVQVRDAGDVRNPGEEYGSPLTSYSAWLR